MANAKKNTDVVEKDSTEKPKRGPVKSFRINDVHASVWAREHNGRTYYSWVVTRSYRDRNGSYRYTSSLNYDDCGSVAELAKQVSEYLYGLETGK